MNRCYWGAAALLVVLALSAISSRWMEKHYAQLEKQMLSAAQAAREGAMDQTLELAEGARTGWDRGRLPTAVLTDHQYLDRIEGAFIQLPSAAQAGDGRKCVCLCLEIAQIFRILSQETQLRWENLL